MANSHAVEETNALAIWVEYSATLSAIKFLKDTRSILIFESYSKIGHNENKAPTIVLYGDFDLRAFFGVENRIFNEMN